jgi:hypothetical protein
MVSPITRWYKWRYSGIITVPTLVILIFAAVYYQQSQLEYFDNWSCETLTDYALGDDVPDRYPKHNEMTDNQHNKLHGYLQECQDNNRFSTPLNHLIETP